VIWTYLGGFILLALVALAAFVGLTYNRLVTLRNRCDNAWAQIDVQLRRRYDLVPNLVETVKGYAAHESGTFEKVIAARQMAMSATTVAEKGAAENVLTGTLKSLFALAEAYPQLQANTSFLELQRQLVETEGKIAYARQFFNDAVMSLNTAVQQFPSNIIAGMFGVKERTYFEIDTAAAEPVAVSFE